MDFIETKSPHLVLLKVGAFGYKITEKAGGMPAFYLIVYSANCSFNIV